MIVPALALALVLVGCGSDDDSSDGDDTTTTTAAEETTTTAGDETGGDDEGTTEPDTTDTTLAPDTTDTTDVPDTTVGGGDSDEFCVAYTALEDADDNADIPDDPQSVQDYIDGFEYILPFAQDAADAAPADIADDLNTLVGSIEDLVDELAGAADVDEAEALLDQVFADEELNDAGMRVDDYYDATCPQAEDDDAQGVPADDPTTGQAPETITPPDLGD